ncbi:hypothetical protein, partial [Vibrio parahaemolyticus]|uniref:hypothetical protein n=1 Tax=Vibrio parahaemolyticus TaxID=670 RepID=UPI001C5F6CA7
RIVTGCFILKDRHYLLKSLYMWYLGNKSHNKAFKRDSQRLAVLVQSLAFVFMAQWFKLGDIALFTP